MFDTDLEAGFIGNNFLLDLRQTVEQVDLNHIHCGTQDEVNIALRFPCNHHLYLFCEVVSTKMDADRIDARLKMEEYELETLKSNMDAYRHF